MQMRILEPSRLSTLELFWENHKKSFIVDVRLSSKYFSGISFIVEKVCRMSILVLYSQSQKFVIDLLVSSINKKHVALTKM